MFFICFQFVFPCQINCYGLLGNNVNQPFITAKIATEYYNGKVPKKLDGLELFLKIRFLRSYSTKANGLKVNTGKTVILNLFDSGSLISASGWWN